MTNSTHSTITHRWPNPRREDATLIVVDEWRANDLAHRTETLAEVMRTWRDDPWPNGVLSDSLFIGEDGHRALRYALWSDEDSYRTAGSDRSPNAVEYTRYRDQAEPGETRTPGCLALPYLVFDTPDRQRLRDWVDTVFSALELDAVTPDDNGDGGLGALFHVSLDGRRILNYAEWVSPRHHDRFMGATGEDDGSAPDPAAVAAWRRVHEYPGIIESGVNRYDLYATAEPVSE